MSLIKLKWVNFSYAGDIPAGRTLYMAFFKKDVVLQLSNLSCNKNQFMVDFISSELEKNNHHLINFITELRKEKVIDFSDVKKCIQYIDDLFDEFFIDTPLEWEIMPLDWQDTKNGGALASEATIDTEFSYQIFKNVIPESYSIHYRSNGTWLTLDKKEKTLLDAKQTCEKLHYFSCIEKINKLFKTVF